MTHVETSWYLTDLERQHDDSGKAFMFCLCTFFLF